MKNLITAYTKLVILDETYWIIQDASSEELEDLWEITDEIWNRKKPIKFQYHINYLDD